MANSKQIVQDALAGRPVRRTPLGPLAVHFCARVAGVSLREYSSNPRVLAESVLRYYEQFKPDAVWVSADTWVSAEAMGAKVGPMGDDQPFGGLGPPLVRTARDLARIPPPEPGSQGRYPVMLEALDRVISALGRDVFVVACFDQYPFSLAAALVGLENLMVKVVEDPPLVVATMERALEYALSYGRALAALGADLLSGGDSPAGLLGPDAYRRVVLPFEKRLIARLKAATNKPVSLHICGPAHGILSDMAASGANVLEIDHQVALADACRSVGPDIGLWGNLDPVGLLAQGSPGQVRSATLQAVKATEACGHHRFVLSSGCTLAVETPFENLHAMLDCERPERDGFAKAPRAAGKETAAPGLPDV